MSKKSVLPADEEAAIVLSGKISTAVRCIAARRGYTITALAEAMGKSRASLTQILNGTTPCRIWTLPLLTAAARVLHTDVHRLLIMAETVSVEEEIPLHFAVRGTKPRSIERLAAVVREVLSDRPDAGEVLSGKDREAVIGCRTTDLKHGAPELYDDYLAGVISDLQLFEILGKAHAFVRKNGGLGHYPFWAATRKVSEK